MKNSPLLLFLCSVAITADAQNIGIGTTTPTASLMISTATNPQLQIKQTNANDFARIRLQTGSARFFDVAAYIGATGANDRLNLFHSQVGDILTLAGNGFVGIGNTNPLVRVDIGGTNGWNLIDGEGDMRIGNPSHRIKFGIALDGGGVGAAGIMQAGGIGNMQLGAGGKYLVELSGNNNYVNLKGLSGGLRIEGSSGSSGQVLTSSGNASAPQWKTLSPVGTGIVTLQGGTQVFLNNDNVVDAGSPLAFTMPANAQLLMWAGVETYKSCAIGPCNSAWIGAVKIDGNEVANFSIQGTAFPSLLSDDKSVGPMILSVSPGAHTITCTMQNRFGNPAASFYPMFMIIPN